MVEQLLSPKWTGESDTPRRATGPQTSEAGCKGGKPRTRRGDTVEQVARGNASEGTSRCREIKPADAGSSADGGQKGRPKRERFQTTQHGHAWYPLEWNPAQSTALQPRKKIGTRNGVTRLWLSGCVPSRQPAASRGRAGCPKKQRPWAMPGIGRRGAGSGEGRGV